MMDMMGTMLVYQLIRSSPVQKPLMHAMISQQLLQQRSASLWSYGCIVVLNTVNGS